MTTGAPSRPTVVTATEGDRASITFTLGYDIDYLRRVSNLLLLITFVF